MLASALLVPVLAFGVAAAPNGASPVILLPGFFGWGQLPLLGPYFGGAKAALEADGFTVYEAAPPPVASNEERTKYLMKLIDDVKRETSSKKVHIIAHSQGGVDTRLALTLGATESIASVVTLATPHRGTSLADQGLLLEPKGPVSLLFDTSAQASQWVQGVPVTAANTTESFTSLSTSGTGRLAARLNDVPQVPFFSVGGLVGRDSDGSCQGGAWSAPVVRDLLNPLLFPFRRLSQQGLGNMSDDAIVPTASMHFGRFLGCAPADHGDWMGWGLDVANDDIAAFDHVPFLLELARGMRDVEKIGSADAMNDHLPRLAKLASAVYLGPPQEIFEHAVLVTRKRR